MTQPPTWGPPPPQQPGGWQGQPGQGGQWGPPQQQWPAPVPPKKGGAAKWAIGAVSLVAVIAVTAVVAVSCTKNGGDSNGGGGGTQTSAAPSDVASANDKGPVGIITEDPSCAPWGPINSTLYEVESKGWLQRDPLMPVAAWTPEVRAQYDAVGKAMRKAADQAVPLAKSTTHRVMRELYGQFIAYVRAYADGLSAYTPVNDKLAGAGSTAANTITAICAAISSGSAAARASSVAPPKPPSSIAPIGDLSNPRRIFDTPDAVCSDIGPVLDSLLLSPAFKNWLSTDPKIAASSWSPEQQAFNDAVTPVMSSTAAALGDLALKSSNPIVQDFILLGVQYRQTYVEAIPTYRPSDQHIYAAGQRSPGVVAGACEYTGG